MQLLRKRFNRIVALLLVVVLKKSERKHMARIMKYVEIMML